MSSASSRAGEPQPRRYHAAVGMGQKLYVCAGCNGRSTPIRASLVQSFDVSSETWQQPVQLRAGYIRGSVGRGMLPDGLNGMAVATDGKNAYFFGGETGTYPSMKCYDSLYKVDMTSLHCKKIAPANATRAPSKRTHCGMVYFDDKLLVHGGFTCEDGRSNELHVFDLKTNMWSVQSTTGEQPPGLSHHTLTLVDPHRAVVFGGIDGQRRVNTTYVLDLDKWHWTKLNDSQVAPPARSCHAACCIAGPLTGQQHPLLLVVGGKDDSFKVSNDLWLLDVDTGSWATVKLPASFTPRSGHSAVVFGVGPQTRMLVLFGGETKPATSLSDTTVLWMELSGWSWEVTKVVRSGELGRPDGRLTEQMRKLELSDGSTDEGYTGEAGRRGRSRLVARGNLGSEPAGKTSRLVQSLGPSLSSESSSELVYLREQLKIARLQVEQAQNSATSALSRAVEAESKQMEMERINSRLQDTERHLRTSEEKAKESTKDAAEEKQHRVKAEQRHREIEERLLEVESRLQAGEERKQAAERRVRQAEDRQTELQQRCMVTEDRLQEAETRLRETQERARLAEEQLADARKALDNVQHSTKDVFWRINREEIHFTKQELGRGGWASVKVARFRGLPVAAKCLHSIIISDYNRQLFVREMSIAARLRHPNLLQFIGATIEGEPVIVTELMATSLRAVLEREPLQPTSIISISRDVARALSYLHLTRPDPIIHRDVSSANVLLNSGHGRDLVAKLSDYGSVNFMRQVTTISPGNPVYAAPEALSPQEQSPKMDVYSYGVLLVEMATRCFPDKSTLLVQIQKIQITGLSALIRRCIKESPSKRPNITDVLLHSALDN